MSEPFWQIKYKGTPIRIGLNDLSNHRLREMKARFGESYGIPTEFIRLLLVGDMDATTGAIWIGQQKAGGEVEDLQAIDFTLDDLEKLEDVKPAGKKGGKKTDPTPAPTNDSDSTPSPSETDTSSTSPTSAD